MVDDTMRAVLIRLDDLEARAFDMQKRLEALELEHTTAIDRHMARNWQDAATRLREAALNVTQKGNENDTESETSSRDGSADVAETGLCDGGSEHGLATGEGWVEATNADRDLESLADAIRSNPLADRAGSDTET
ncbi:MAG: hypothetical protein AAGL99_16980 [Pseudomonadota bacterium]